MKRSGIMLIEWLIIVVVVLLIAGTVVPGYIRWRTDRTCLEHGYPSSRVMWPDAARYCIKRVDQTDVVIPLDSVR